MLFELYTWHWVNFRKGHLRTGHWMPAITRSTFMVSLSKDHIFTPREIDYAMGWPVLPEGNELGKQLPDIYNTMYEAGQGKRLAGNGMTMQQVTSWLLYLLSHLVRRDAVSRWRPPLVMQAEAAPSGSHRSGDGEMKQAGSSA